MKATITAINGAKVSASNGRVYLAAAGNFEAQETVLGESTGAYALFNIELTSLADGIKNMLTVDPNDDTRYLATEASKNLAEPIHVNFTRCTEHDEKDGVYWCAL